jgi:hypothetical protein
MAYHESTFDLRLNAISSLDNMGGISLIFLVHYLVLYIKLLENGTDLSAW